MFKKDNLVEAVGVYKKDVRDSRDKVNLLEQIQEDLKIEGQEIEDEIRRLGEEYVEVYNRQLGIITDLSDKLEADTKRYDKILRKYLVLKCKEITGEKDLILRMYCDERSYTFCILDRSNIQSDWSDDVIILVGIAKDKDAYIHTYLSRKTSLCSEIQTMKAYLEED